MANERGDDLGQEIKFRLAGIIDLVAEEACYHYKCYSLLNNKVQSNKVKNVKFTLYHYNISVLL